MPIQIFVTDTPFTDSPDAGHPECICSRCNFKIEEDEFVLRCWETDTTGQVIENSLEWRFCPTCQRGMGIFHSDVIPDDDVP